MTARTVDWVGLRSRQPTAGAGAGLREQKKRRMRQQLTDTATEMFMERGFDAVRVAEIAEACGVSEKTVFNYFPSKEALVVDHPEATMEALRSGLDDPDVEPVEAVRRILADELTAITTWLDAQDDPVEAAGAVRRFAALIRSTPSLRAYQRDMTERLIAAAADLLAARVGMRADDPEPQVAAVALLGLWQVQFGGLRKYLDGTRTTAQLRDAVGEDVRRAAVLVEAGVTLLPRRGGS